ncbi:MAG: HNH endonuclease [Dehalococcoidia bacterium]|nr:HNH endonuclease [Dehalococcoidia bacterium]MDD5493253.1 HNH endonuclease [Dehalococcoidia bacterium]
MNENLINLPVLVLNENYLPLNICRVRRAVVLVLIGKAEVIENGRGYFHSTTGMFDIPSVIRLVYMVRKHSHLRKMTKLEIFNRDRYVCQYCGRETKELTLDHVIPRRRDGQHTWENVVAACIPCNRRKAGRTPVEAGMPLLRKPCAPGNIGFYIPYQYMRTREEWQKYLPHTR